MMFVSPSLVISLASFFLCTVAEVSLGTFPDVVQPGELYTLNWTATENYTYNLWLIREKPGDNEYSWSKVSTLFSGLESSSLNGSYSWTVPRNLSNNSNYALWLACFVIPFDDEMVTNVTNWFAVSSSTSPATSTTSSAATTASASMIASVIASTIASSVASISPGSDHHHLSGGAIAGIVIGCIVALALVIGAVLFSAWYRKRSSVKQREAAARANRLEPVMQKGSTDYEMHGTNPS